MTIYIKTDVGQQAFKDRSPLLAARQRAAFVLLDGQRSVHEVLSSTAGLGLTVADFEHMANHGLIRPAPDAAPATPETPGTTATPAQVATPSATVTSPALSDAQRYQQAYPMAIRITADLGLRGFRLNLAVEAASGFADLAALLPKIQAAAGEEKCRPLAAALKR